MSDWRKRGCLRANSVFFRYVQPQLEKQAHMIYIWDIDKTYLDTHFESLRGLIKTIREKAFQKKNIPGTHVLLKSLMAIYEREDAFPIYFVSASPPQLEKKIRIKLELDGIKPYGAYFKESLKDLNPKYFRRLNRQVGYKLQSLLDLRTRLKDSVNQILWGDDSESDAVVYSLYSDICAKRLTESEIRKVLDNLDVEAFQIDIILELQKKILKEDPVKKIYINLINDTDPDYYLKFGRRMLPTSNTLQLALDLYQDKRINKNQLIQVAQDMMSNYGFIQDEMSQTFDDFIERGVLERETVITAYNILMESEIFPPYYKHYPLSDSYTVPQSETKGWIPDYIDYFNDFR